MNKDAFYFPHFSNARHDRKLKRVIKELGVEGYGIYFMILEILRDQDGFTYPLEDIDLLADEFGTSEQKVRTVISNYKLFQVDEEERFFSIKFNEFMQPYLTMKEQRRQAGLKSGEARRQKALANNQTNDRSTDVQRELNEIEQRKGKERKQSKENKEDKDKKSSRFTPPSLEQVQEYCQERMNNVNAETFIDFYSAKGWMVGKNKMKDWKACIRTWEKRSGNQQKSNNPFKDILIEEGYKQ